MPLEAALQGARGDRLHRALDQHLAGAVFIPILLMGGIVGRLFREFAVTLSRGHRHVAGGFADHHAHDVRRSAQARAEEQHGRLYRASEWCFERHARRYELSLGWVLRHPAS